jgi:hypothetical protein
MLLMLDSKRLKPHFDVLETLIGVNFASLAIVGSY